LCGHLLRDAPLHCVYGIFEEHKVTYEAFCDGHREMLADPNLVVRIEDHYYDWAAAAPSIISMLAFKQQISTDRVGQPLAVVAPSAKEEQPFDIVIN
jgi:hypothetical protein